MTTTTAAVVWITALAVTVWIGRWAWKRVDRPAAEPEYPGVQQPHPWPTPPAVSRRKVLAGIVVVVSGARLREVLDVPPAAPLPDPLFVDRIYPAASMCLRFRRPLDAPAVLLTTHDRDPLFPREGAAGRLAELGFPWDQPDREPLKLEPATKLVSEETAANNPDLEDVYMAQVTTEGAREYAAAAVMGKAYAG